MSIEVMVKGVDKTSYLSKNTLRISKQIGNKNSLSCSFNCTADDWLPSIGQDIKIYDNGDVLFGGVITSLNINEQEPLRNSAAYTIVSINSDGYDKLCARRTINAYYTNKTAGFIFENIVDVVLNSPSNSENVTKGSITAGNTFTKYSAVCKNVKDIFDEIAEQSGVQWYIDNTKTINLVTESTITTALYTIDVSGSFTDFIIKGISSDIQNYCNKVFVKGNTDDVYTYSQDTSEITARIAIEGTAYTSGVYGKVIAASDIDSITALSTIADNELKKYSFEPSTIQIQSFTSGWEPNQKVTCYLPKYGITSNTDYLVEEVVIWRYDTNILAYDVNMVKRKSADFSTQKEFKGFEYFEKLCRQKDSSSGSMVGETGQIKNYQDSITATATITTGGTLITTKTFDLKKSSDIHLSFSSYIECTAALTFTATTQLQEGTAAATTKTYQPKKIFSSNETFSYCDYIESVSAGSTTVSVSIGVSESGSATINSGQCAMNLIVFPKEITAFYTTATDPLDIINETPVQIITGDKTMDYNNYKRMTTDGTYIYVSFKYDDGSYNYWKVYKSDDNGATWNDTNMPSWSVYNPTASTNYKAPSLCYNNGKLYAAYWSYDNGNSKYEIVWNTYNGSAWSNAADMNRVMSAGFSSINNADLQLDLVVSNSGVIHLFYTYNSSEPRHKRSDNDGTSWQTAYDLQADLGFAANPPFAILDSDGSSVHLVCKTSTPNIEYLKWTQATTSWGGHIDVKSGGSYNGWPNILQNTNGDIYIIAHYVAATFQIFRSTDGGSSFSSVETLVSTDAENIFTSIYNNKLYSIRARSSSNTALSIEAYDIANDTWDNNNSLPFTTVGDVKAYNASSMFANGYYYIVYQSGASTTAMDVSFLRLNL